METQTSSTTSLTENIENMLLLDSPSVYISDQVFETLHPSGSDPSGNLNSDLMKKMDDLQELFFEAVSNISSSKKRELLEKKHKLWQENKGI